MTPKRQSKMDRRAQQAEKMCIRDSNQGSAASGAFSRTQIGAVGGGLGGGQYNSSGCGPNLYSFDSRVSNPIYGASNTVQPPALTLLPCIKAFDAYPAVQAGISAMNAIGAPTRAARATVEPVSYTHLDVYKRQP